MKQCPCCKYQYGLDPDNGYHGVVDEDFIEIEQAFIAKGKSYDPHPNTIRLDVCPKCGVAFSANLVGF